MSLSVSVRRAARALVVATALLGSIGAQAASAGIQVDDDKAQCPKAGFRTIARALAFAPPGATVVVCSGTYVGSLVMDKPGVRLEGQTLNPPAGSPADVRVVPARRDLGRAVVAMVAPATTLANVTIRDRAPALGEVCPEELVQVANAAASFTDAAVIDGVAVRQDPACGALGGSGITIAGQAAVRNSTIAVNGQGVVMRSGFAQIRGNLIRAAGFGVAGIAVEGGLAGIEHNQVSRYRWGLFLNGGAAGVGGADKLGNDLHHNTVGVFLSRSVAATVFHNKIHDNSRFGIELQAQSVGVTENRVFNNGTGGIVVELVDPQPSENLFRDNVAFANGPSAPTGSVPADCIDPTTGPRTAGTANVWVNNVGASVPRGICSPPAP